MCVCVFAQLACMLPVCVCVCGRAFAICLSHLSRSLPSQVLKNILHSLKSGSPKEFVFPISFVLP